jgi:hypothetical protein
MEDYDHGDLSFQKNIAWDDPDLDSYSSYYEKETERLRGVYQELCKKNSTNKLELNPFQDNFQTFYNDYNAHVTSLMSENKELKKALKSMKFEKSRIKNNFEASEIDTTPRIENQNRRMKENRSNHPLLEMNPSKYNSLAQQSYLNIPSFNSQQGVMEKRKNEETTYQIWKHNYSREMEQKLIQEIQRMKSEYEKSFDQFKKRHLKELKDQKLIIKEQDELLKVKMVN